MSCWMRSYSRCLGYHRPWSYCKKRSLMCSESRPEHCRSQRIPHLRRCRIVVQIAMTLSHCGTVLLRRRRIVVQFAATSSHCGTVCCGSPFLVVIESCYRGSGCVVAHVTQECREYLADRFSRLETISQHLRDMARAVLTADEAACSRCAFVALQTTNSVLALLFRIRIELCHIHSSLHRI